VIGARRSLSFGQDRLFGQNRPSAGLGSRQRESGPAKKRLVADSCTKLIDGDDSASWGGDEYSTTPKKLRSIVNHTRHTGIHVVTLQEGIRLMNPERNNLNASADDFAFQD
jgi:hypothetical protein